MRPYREYEIRHVYGTLYGLSFYKNPGNPTERFHLRYYTTTLHKSKSYTILVYHHHMDDPLCEFTGNVQYVNDLIYPKVLPVSRKIMAEDILPSLIERHSILNAIRITLL